MNELTAVEVSASPIEKYREYLATQGMRMTPERSIIVEEVFSDHEHFDREQITARLAQREDGRRVSRSTVHRTLNLLEEAGLLRKVARITDREVFEHDYGYPQHDHLICEKCHSLIEFQNEAVSKIIEDVAAQHGFRVDHHRLEVFGQCQECSKPRKRRHNKLDMV